MRYVVVWMDFESYDEHSDWFPTFARAKAFAATLERVQKSTRPKIAKLVTYEDSLDNDTP